MHYDGSFEVVSNRTKVYEFATDPSRIATAFPDVQDVKVEDAEHFTLKAKVGISFIRGLMNAKCVIIEKTPAEFVKLKISAQGLGSAVEMESGFSFQDSQNGGTLVKWYADANVAGSVAGTGSRLLESAADKYIKQIVEALKQKLS